MALIDLSLVTTALQTLLEECLKRSGLWAVGTEPKVVPLPPDKLADTDKSVGIYLYHATEDPHHKNLLATGQDTPPVSFVPMGLNLFYLLTAHAPDSQNNDSPLEEQKIMGVAMKAMHDYPVINDSTFVGVKQVFPTLLCGAGNRIRIALLPVASNEAVSYWTAGSSPLRMAAQYEVSVVLLEPEEPKTRPGRVLAYGVQTFVAGMPRLESSWNKLVVTLPSETEPREIELRPAQTPPAKDDPEPVPEASWLNLDGYGLLGLNSVLQLKHARWDEPLPVDDSWQAAISSEKARVLVRETITKGTDTYPVFPGIYGASVRVTRRTTMSDGRVVDTEHDSNEIPFAVAPRVDKAPSSAASGDEVEVEGYVFEDDDPPPPPQKPRVENLAVYVGASRYGPKSLSGLQEGEFEVVSSTKLRLHMLSDTDDGFYPVRVIVNGIESPPVWLKVSSP